MPRYVHIENVEIDLGAVVDAEDADYAVWACPARGDDGHTWETLVEELVALASKVPAVAVTVVMRNEDGVREAMSLGRGVVAPTELPRRVVAREDAEIAAPQRDRKPAPGYAAYLAMEARATRAVEENDMRELVALLDDKSDFTMPDCRHRDFRHSRLVDVRTSIWRALLLGGYAFEMPRVLEGFAEEGEQTCHAIAYHLHHVPALAPEVADAAVAATAPEIRRWCESAIASWPDFPGRSSPALAQPVHLSFDAATLAHSDPEMAKAVDEALTAAAARASGKRAQGVAAAKVAIATAEKSRKSADCLAALDLPGTMAPSLARDRSSLWADLLARERPVLGMPRVLRALAEEVPEVAHVIAYKLYLQKHLAGDLARAVREVRRRAPPPEPLAKRLDHAVAEWPDFGVPQRQ